MVIHDCIHRRVKVTGFKDSDRKRPKAIEPIYKNVMSFKAFKRAKK